MVSRIFRCSFEKSELIYFNIQYFSKLFDPFRRCAGSGKNHQIELFTHNLLQLGIFIDEDRIVVRSADNFRNPAALIHDIGFVTTTNPIFVKTFPYRPDIHTKDH